MLLSLISEARARVSEVREALLAPSREGCKLPAKRRRLRRVLERAKGIEPSYAAWEAAVLPLNYARERLTSQFFGMNLARSAASESIEAIQVRQAPFSASMKE